MKTSQNLSKVNIGKKTVKQVSSKLGLLHMPLAADARCSLNLMNICLFALYLEKFSNKAKKIPSQKQPSKCSIDFGKLLQKYPWCRSYFSKVKLLKLLNKEYDTTTLQRTL